MPDERRFTHLLCGQIHVRAEASDDDAVAALASRQRGIARRSQLLEIGVGRRSIDYRLEVGRLRHLFRGVYAVGHEAVPFDGRALAAVWQ